MQFLIGFLAGLVIGITALFICLKTIRHKQRPIGDLRVDGSDPSDHPYLFLELDKGENVNTIISSKYATFRVKLENFLPHK